jgi:antagonist of KipI
MEALPVLKVLKRGVYCALQDTGRFGYRHLGVPCSGAMDRHSYMYANHRLGNNPNATQLEIYGQGAVFMVLSDCVLFISGAESEVTVDKHKINTAEPISVYRGQALSLDRIFSGARVYISVKGGFYCTPVMDSMSTLAGTHLTPLEKDEIIYMVSGSEAKHHSVASIGRIRIDKRSKIPALPGPEFNWLAPESMVEITSKHFIISQMSNRMGYRLSGDPLPKVHQQELLTSAVMPGTVQCTPDGQLIILMRDCQTTGGYPRILQVEEWGISQLAQRLPGDEVVFQISTK